jgi:hypothetical protein
MSTASGIKLSLAAVALNYRTMKTVGFESEVCMYNIVSDHSGFKSRLLVHEMNRRCARLRRSENHAVQVSFPSLFGRDPAILVASSQGRS